MSRIFPFTAIVGQERMKRALILNAIHPQIGGVLIRGERGTAKSTAARALAFLLPQIQVVADCHFGCDPDLPSTYCDECRARVEAGEVLPVATRRTGFVDLPVSATEDRVVGTLDIEQAIQRGERHFEPGVLASANRGLLYVDEVNLLDDHVVDLLLDSAAMGVNVVEREGISFSHPAEFILVGTMNPEEGDLRPQLLDRFGLAVDMAGIHDPKLRVEIVKRRIAYEQDADDFGANGSRGSGSCPAASSRRATCCRWSLHRPRPLRHRRADGRLQGGRPPRRHRDPQGRPRPRRLRGAHGHQRPRYPAGGRAGPAASHEAPALPGSCAGPGPAGAEAAPGPGAGPLRDDRDHQRYGDGRSLKKSAEGSESVDSDSQPGPQSTDAAPQSSKPGEQKGKDKPITVGQTFQSKRLDTPLDKLARRQAGRRSVTRTDRKRGRYIKSRPAGAKPQDIAFDATMREAAVHQKAAPRGGRGQGRGDHGPGAAQAGLAA
jgi:hypothetical protein